MDGWLPYPSTNMARATNLTLYQARKQLRLLKEAGLVKSQTIAHFDEMDYRTHLISGYVLTETAKDTEEYKQAMQKEIALCKKYFGTTIAEGLTHSG